MHSVPITRSIYVRPPIEADVGRGKIWLLRKLSYGITEAIRQWATVIEDWILNTAGSKWVYEVSQLYVKRGSSNSITGILSKVTEDILTAGSTAFMHYFMTRLKTIFPISRVIVDGRIVFNCYKIYQLENDNVFLSMRSYLSQIQPLFIDAIKNKESRTTLQPHKMKAYRKLAGELVWI